MQVLAAVAAILGACASTPVHPRATTGAIAGLARDHDSGDPVEKAQIRVRAQGSQRPVVAVSGEQGLYDVDQLAPGNYSLVAQFAGQPIEVENIVVRAGERTIVDLVFTLGRPDPIRVDYGDPKVSEIDRYRPPHLAPSTAIIEGTVNDQATHERVAGAVVTAVGPDLVATTQQTVTDDQGRYRFEGVAPGVYQVSAYYNVTGRAQIEARRSGIAVAGAEAVIVPLWVELGR